MTRGYAVDWTGLNDFLEDLFFREKELWGRRYPPKDRILMAELVRMLSEKYKCHKQTAWEKVREMLSMYPTRYRLEWVMPKATIDLENSNRRRKRLWIVVR